MKYFVLLSEIILMFIVSFSCSSPSGPGNNLSLQLSDVSCTEAWLSVTGPNSSEVILNRDGKEVRKVTLTTSPQTIYDDSLLPNSAYTYQAIINNKTSNKISAKTLDTTSSDFTFQTFSVGGNAGSCAFYDCAIISDTLAYVVGEVYLNDSTGQPDPNAYNLAKWNGHNWQLLRIQFFTVRGNSHRTPYPTSSILAFNDSLIWISMDGDQVAKWNGKIQEETMFIPNSFSIKRIWGENSKSIYAVGDNGNIDYYTNGSWQKIESGTTTNIRDIWGVNDPTDNSTLIYCAVSNIFSQDDYKILRINSDNTVSEKVWPYAHVITSVWFKSKYKLYVCGDIVAENSIDDQWKIAPGFPDVGNFRIRGTDYNDIYVVGSYSLVAHFNGARWKIITQPSNPNQVYYSCAVKRNTMIAVGQNGSQAMITIFKRE